MTDSRIRVILADDHAVVRAGLERIIDATDELVVHAQVGDVDGLRAYFADDAWQVLVLDLHMPGGQGTETVEMIHRARPDVGIVVFSMHEEDSYAVSVLRAGARAYLNKSRSPSELIAAIQRVAAGGRYVTQELAEHFFNLGDDVERQCHDRLSARERDIFERLARGTKPTTIAKDLRLGRSTVTTYVHRIKQKLGVTSLGEIVRYAHQHNIVE